MTRRPEDRKKKPAKNDAEEDLPILEAIADELEQVAGSDQVKVACAASTEAGFDAIVDVEVGAMDKKAMADAVTAALRRATTAAAALLRNHRVVVRFLGDTIIGTAVRDAAGAVLGDAKARKVVIRRGYGDELLRDQPAPRVRVEKQVDGDTVRVQVATGELEAADLPAAMQQELVGLVSNARGLKFSFAFSGAARPDAALRELLGRTLGDAGALRAAIGERVLFDRELESRVRVTPRGDEVGIEIAPSERETETQEALAMVLPAASERLAGRIVHVRFSRRPAAGEFAQAVAYCLQAAPRRLEVQADGAVDVVLPRLLEVEQAGGEATLRVQDGGRDRAAMVLAMRRECAELGAKLARQTIVFEWPAGGVVAAAVADECMGLAIEALQPAAVRSREAGVAGEPELVWPAPFVVGTDAAVRTLRIDTDAGKPAQLLAALDRRLPGAIANWRGAAARVQIAGAAAPSRTLVKTVVAMLEGAGVQRVEIDSNGAVDVVLPLLLQCGGSSEQLRVAINTAGRDASQIDLALQRELAAVEWRGAAVTVADSPLLDRVVAAAIERGAVRVVLDGREPVQLYPRLLTMARDGMVVRLQAAAADDAMARRQLARELPAVLDSIADLGEATVNVSWPGATASTGAAAELVRTLVERGAARVLFDQGAGARQVHPQVVLEYVTLLGRKDDGAAPMLMLAIDRGDGSEHEQKVLARLGDFSALLPGRRVLLVARGPDGDEAAAPDDPTLAAVRGAIDSVAAATLVYRGRDRAGRSHFAVAFSADPALVVGALFADPRPRR